MDRDTHRATTPATPSRYGGEAVEARTATGAAAVLAVLNGASVADAYLQQAIVLPPAGTPLNDPVAPQCLRAGDVGVWKDHLATALGGGEMLVSGHVRPVDSVSSAPDFLGWFDPTKLAKDA